MNVIKTITRSSYWIASLLVLTGWLGGAWADSAHQDRESRPIQLGVSGGNI